MKNANTTLRLGLQPTRTLKVRVGLFFILASAQLGGLQGDRLSATWAQGPSSLPAPHFTVPSTMNMPSGSFALRWKIPVPFSPNDFELQQADQKGFHSPQAIYSGPDGGTYLSGLPDGDYYFRVRRVNAKGEGISPWSPPVHRFVQHPSLGFAFFMMAVGATVFLSTMALIIQGPRKEPGG